MSILDNLNKEQKEAALKIKGPVLILAGAGTGKTRTITYRIAYMIGELGLSPMNILAVTFTNKAAKEMKERVESLLGPGVYSPTIGTFHSVSVRILREYIDLLGYEKNFSIYDTDDSLKVIKNICKELRVDIKKIKPKALLGAISAAKNKLIDFNKYKDVTHDDFTELASEVYEKYQKTLKSSNAVDFDDLIMLTIQLFRENADVLTKFRTKWQYIHVDEYQDVNYAQHIWTKLLAEGHNNICVVGDDWQGIYSWRGADIQNILDFPKEYSGTKTIKLEQNYRSTQNILDSAQSIISKNLNRTDKKLWTEDKENTLIRIFECYNEKHEGDKIISSIEDRLNKGDISSLSDAVVLYRTNAQSRSIEEACLRNQIPYQIIGGTKFYERKEIKDILAYLTILLNPQDEVALSRIINVPTRGIGDTSFSKVISYSRTNDTNAWESIKNIDNIDTLNNGTKEKFKNFYKLILDLQEFASKNTASEIIREALDKSMYISSLEDNPETADTRIENLQELLSVSQKYDELKADESLSSFLEEISLLSDIDNLTDSSSKLTLMTMHSAKGLEFTAVYIAGTEENLFPHIRAIYNEEEMEEERRLAYVAITRAKKYCHISFCKSRMLYGNISQNTPSRFISELPKDLAHGLPDDIHTHKIVAVNVDEPTYNPVVDDNYEISYTVGQIVTHPHFGKGEVKSIRGDLLTIKFSVGEKTIAASIAQLN
jgi:DNA helicase-2/ATP-dependent DNA helicase PcrA